MHWADKIAKEIIDSGKYQPHRIDDMFTPSGFAHIGSLRGPFVHDLVYHALKDAGKKVDFTYVFNDFDPLDGIPPGLSRFSEYLGFPLRKVPSPQKGFENFADYFSKDFQKILADLGIKPQFFSSWDMYQEGKFDEVIKIALDNTEKIQDIYQKISGSQKKEKGWLPFQVICENCGKLGTTKVYKWDGKEVAYKCEPEMVKWARGCEHEGKISPFRGTGKLPWKVDWPAHWKVLGVTIEGAGKDHASAGGSYDIAMELCRKVFNYPQPYKFAYEFFLLGGKKMSSSRGVGLRARDLGKALPANIARFLFSRTDYRQTIEFNPVGTMAIPDLFDEYDRTQGEKSVFLPRFRDVANYIQLPNIDTKKRFEEIKGSQLNSNELKILKERGKYAGIWLEKYAPENFKFKFSEAVPAQAERLTDRQKTYLQDVANLINKGLSADQLQLELYNLAKTIHIDSKEAFAAIYLALIGRNYGPRAAWFLLQYPREKITKRLREVSK